MDIDPITGTTSIVIDLVVLYSGTLSFNKINMYSRADIIGDDIIFHYGIACCIIIIYYTLSISIDCTVSNCEAFPMNKVNALDTIVGTLDFSSDIAMPLDSTAECAEPRRGLIQSRNSVPSAFGLRRYFVFRGDKSLAFQTVPVNSRTLHPHPRSA